jgi:glucosamine--fructose-6-phosphate aminotransferase (isomerizing)
MCGIVGYVGERDAVPILLEGLKRLEYRGYDSAGIAVIQQGRIEVRRSQGKIGSLARLLEQEPLRGTIGVAHTRWATHGRPCPENAHPHRDCTGSLAVVHNGIIENHGPLRRSLIADGHEFQSETDSEVVAHLIEASDGEDLEQQALRAAGRLAGAFALGILAEPRPDSLLAMRSGGPPLVLGEAGHGVLLASDVAALLPHTRDVVTLGDGEMAVLGREGAELRSFDGHTVRRGPARVAWDAGAAERAGFRHYMLKEIHEQPRAIADACRGRMDLDAGRVDLSDAGLDPARLRSARRLAMVACGTSWHAALLGKHMVERLCRLPVEVDLASEFRYREPLLDQGALTVAISQSGETADTLGAAREARRLGSAVLAVCNVAGSTLGRESDGVLLTRAGPEIGVASTKAFTTQLATLYLLATHLGRERGALDAAQARDRLRDLAGVPALAEETLRRCGTVEALAGRFNRRPSVLFLGRGPCFPLALEGALKLKEVSYIHAEGYAAGEMKHGPIALVDARVPVVVIAPGGRLHDKTLAGIEEIKARDGVVIALCRDGDEDVASRADHVLFLPEASDLLTPMLWAIPLQLLAYHAAALLGRDVDQPRNLAKSVTVE